MERYKHLMARVEKGERILIDGATGTEIERRGVPQLDNAWNGGGALSHPDILLNVHEDYIRAGAEIVISNTFATSRHALRDAGMDQHFDALNRRGVELAIEARANLSKPRVLVAGGISYWSWSGKHPPLDALRDSIDEQAEIMREAGADLLMLEMMVDIDRMVVTLDAALACGLPVWVGLTTRNDPEGAVFLRNGEPLADALTAIADREVPVISIMHIDVEEVDTALEGLQQHWEGVVGAYPHSAKFVDHKCLFEEVISPEAYAAHCNRWLERGVQIIGGCCGLGVDHIAALRELV